MDGSPHFVGPRASFEYRAMAAKFVGPHMEFRARKESPSEGKDLLGLDCITLDRKMALPINPVHTLDSTRH